jgi:hypothetical protein
MLCILINMLYILKKFRQTPSIAMRTYARFHPSLFFRQQQHHWCRAELIRVEWSIHPIQFTTVVEYSLAGFPFHRNWRWGGRPNGRALAQVRRSSAGAEDDRERRMIAVSAWDWERTTTCPQWWGGFLYAGPIALSSPPRSSSPLPTTTLRPPNTRYTRIRGWVCVFWLSRLY